MTKFYEVSKVLDKRTDAHGRFLIQASLEIEPYLSCLQKTSQCAVRVSPRKLFLGY